MPIAPKPRPIFIAALPREISGFVNGWRADETLPARNIHLYWNDHAIAACAGMGADRARLAVEAALSLGPASELISIGFAGACQTDAAVGQVLWPDIVIDSKTGERFFTETWHEVLRDLARAQSRPPQEELPAPPLPDPRVLVTVPKPADASEKRRLGESYLAFAVDMEAAAVARIARARDEPFTAIKAISDAHDFDLPGLARFTTPDGQFREAAFALHLALHPNLWKSVATLAKGSTLAANNLRRALEAKIKQVKIQQSTSQSAN